MPHSSVRAAQRTHAAVTVTARTRMARVTANPHGIQAATAAPVCQAGPAASVTSSPARLRTPGWMLRQAPPRQRAWEAPL